VGVAVYLLRGRSNQEVTLAPSDTTVAPALSRASGTPPIVEPTTIAERVVHLAIAPAGASAEVDEHAVAVENGGVEIRGALGGSHRVTIRKGGRVASSTVVIGDTGPVPSKLEIDAATTAAARPTTPAKTDPTAPKPADKELADKEISTLAGLIGSLEIKDAEAGATIVIDGRSRGTIPAPKPLRVAVGTHVVRVYKDGFEAFETRVEVAGRETKSIAARLAHLSQAGRLKVVEQTGKSLDVVLDNVVVGKTPWEGPLATGDHVVFLRSDEIGTQPASAPVKINQVTPLTLLAEPLTATLRVEPTPAGAAVALDGVNLGNGLWEGRLRAGTHKVEIAAEGFRRRISIKSMELRSPLRGERSCHVQVVEQCLVDAVLLLEGGAIRQ
jgi:hypothetical protein